MSIETVKSFYEKVVIDKAIQKEIKKVDQKREAALREAIEGIVEIAKSEGFEFSVEDLIEARKEAAAGEARLAAYKTRDRKENEEEDEEWEDCWLASGCGWGLLWTGPPECGQGVAHIPPGQELPEE
jgi:hypothetical protein